MAKPFSDQSIPERVATLESALEKVLDRGPEMRVGSLAEAPEFGNAMGVWVYEKGQPDIMTVHSLYDIARELEVLLP